MCLAASSSTASAVDRHNYWRVQHSVPPLTWDTKLASSAQVGRGDTCLAVRVEGGVGGVQKMGCSSGWASVLKVASTAQMSRVDRSGCRLGFKQGK
jgi:hypothetical protein